MQTFSALQPRTRTFPSQPAERPLLRLTRPGSGEYLWLHKGKQGSLQTAAEMARLVREDTVRDEGLQAFAAKILISNGLDSHADRRNVATVLCRYVQAIPYIFDPSGSFDSISSARQTLEKGFGDCDDLAVLLATLLALVGFEPRFVLARYNSKSKGYDHVYVDVLLPDGRMCLDPCSRTHEPGWESMRFYERLMFPIFAFPTTSLGDAMQLAATGASIGASFIPGVGPIVAALIGPAMSMFSRKQQRSEESARDTYKDQVLRSMEDIKAAVNSCKLTPAQGVQAARQLITAFYSACDQFTKKSVTASCHNFEDQDMPGGAQEGAFKTHQAAIENAGGSCGGAQAVTSPGGVTSPGVTGNATGGGMSLGGNVSVGGSSFPIWLLLAGGVAVYLMVKK